MTRPEHGPQQEPQRPQAGRWPVWKLGLLLYPFATAAVVINLFMPGLLWQAVGFGALSPYAALWASVPLGVPATWAAARWVRHLIDSAEA
ncbi:MAG: hypothetical protein K0B16_17125 [Burkholderiaceae bacterium]|nr:hypothetical protein [Burkholderiaceae bacterium]